MLLVGFGHWTGFRRDMHCILSPNINSEINASRKPRVRAKVQKHSAEDDSLLEIMTI